MTNGFFITNTHFKEPSVRRLVHHGASYCRWRGVDLRHECLGKSTYAVCWIVATSGGLPCAENQKTFECTDSPIVTGGSVSAQEIQGAVEAFVHA